MALDTEVKDSATGLQVVDRRAQVQLPDATLPAKVGALRIFSENDDGSLTGAPSLLSPETDPDYRLRVSTETLMDADNFYSTAVATGKYRQGSSTHTIGATASGLLLNQSSSTAVGGSEISSYAFFPIYGSGVVYFEVILAFSNQPVSNGVFEAGLFLSAGAGAAAPTDGVFLRMTDAGFFAVASFNSTEESLALPNLVYATNQALKLQIVIGNRQADFWVDNKLLGTLRCSASRATLASSAALPWRAQYRQPAVAGGAFQARLFNVVVAIGGVSPVIDFDDVGNAMHGSYQGLPGSGAQGSLANYVNNANPTAAVPSNTTAALGNGLGGQFWETDTMAVNQDGIISSFQVPAGSIAFPGRRLSIKAITIDSYVQAAVVAGGYNAQWTLAFGATAVSLATTEAANAKAPRRTVLGVQTVVANAPALTQLNRVQQTFTRPVIVNPGEFVQAVKKKVGTVPTAGVIAHLIHFDCGWI